MCPVTSTRKPSAVMDDMVIAGDPGDIRRKFAAKMKRLVKFHDASDHKIGDGYRLRNDAAADLERMEVAPPYLEACSQEAKDVRSENGQILKVVDAVGLKIYNKGIDGF